MKEIQEILKKIESLQPNEKAILATVVDVQGSSYRLPGAKMLILENGDTFGTVSGGCLEADVLERAKQVLETGEPQVFVYDTTKDVDSVFSLNMGCRGVIRILLERVGSRMSNSAIHFFKSRKIVKFPAYLATLITSNGKYKIGTRADIDWTGPKSSEFFDGEDEIIWRENKINWDSPKSFLKTFEFGEVFVEYVAPPTNILIFGAGSDAVPLADIAKSVGWHVTVVDHRKKFANEERFLTADEILISHPEQTSENIKVGESSVAVVMTHNYEHDKNILRVLLKSNAKYIGKLGPKRRSENMLREFQEEGLGFTEDELAKFYSPVGLDIGADTPEAIALSIVAEIQAVLSGRDGGFLRNRKGSIYGRDE